jgi:hypothetical protein
MKSKLLLFSAALFTMFSCTNDSEGISVQNTTIPLIQKSVATSWSGQTITSSWTYDQNKLVSIVSDNGSQQLFTYTGDLITQIATQNEFGELTTDIFAYDSQNRLALHQELSGNFGRKEVYEYDSDGNVAVTKYFGTNLSQDDIIEHGIMIFEDGEVVHTKTSELASGVSQICDYTYDNKNSPSKNILGYDKISALLSANLKGISKNVTLNIQTTAGSESNKIVKTYTYNNANYPTQISSMDPLDGDSGTVTYSYE